MAPQLYARTSGFARRRCFGRRQLRAAGGAAATAETEERQALAIAPSPWSGRRLTSNSISAARRSFAAHFDRAVFGRRVERRLGGALAAADRGSRCPRSALRPGHPAAATCLAVHLADRDAAAVAGPLLRRWAWRCAHAATFVPCACDDGAAARPSSCRSAGAAGRRGRDRRRFAVGAVEGPSNSRSEAEVAGDAAHLRRLVGQHEADPGAAAAGAAGAADPVHVGVLVAGCVEVDHVGDAGDVDAAGGDVGGDQRVDVAALEAGQRPFALALALVAVHRDRRRLAAAQPLDQPVGAALGADEDQGAAAVGVAQLQRPAGRAWRSGSRRGRSCARCRPRCRSPAPGCGGGPCGCRRRRACRSRPPGWRRRRGSGGRRGSGRRSGRRRA